MAQATGKDEQPAEEFIEHGQPAPGEAVDHETMVSLASAYVPGSAEEKKLLRKLDFRIIVSRTDFLNHKTC